ncbi:MAG: hypothetical protein GC193_14280 [Cryomorphaceae bacterium]|nr:hypothetical protein [Cryomorphaceae bacterium]
MRQLVLGFLISLSFTTIAQTPFIGTVKYAITDANGNDNGVVTIHSDGTNFHCQELVGEFSLATLELPEQRSEFMLVTFLGRQLALATPADKFHIRSIPESMHTASAGDVLGLKCMQTVCAEGVVTYSPDYLLNYRLLPAVPGLPVEFEFNSELGKRKYKLTDINHTAPDPSVFHIPEGFTIVGSDELMTIFDGLTAE